MGWDPELYLRFADHRTRPGLELLGRIDHDNPRHIVDLGAGTGNLTALLSRRWPSADIIGVDSSASMLDNARRDHPDITWIEADIASWKPEDPVDVLYSNASLHWLDDHPVLFARLRSWLAPGGVLAVQMPDNWQAPTHRVPADVLDSGRWPPEAVDALLRDRLSAPHLYRRWLQPATVDLWRTTYFQELTGPDPVWNWVSGSVLGPVLAALDEDNGRRFGTICRQRYAGEYPVDSDGTVLLPFSRLFMVAGCR